MEILALRPCTRKQIPGGVLSSFCVHSSPVTRCKASCTSCKSDLQQKTMHDAFCVPLPGGKGSQVALCKVSHPTLSCDWYSHDMHMWHDTYDCNEQLVLITWTGCARRRARMPKVQLFFNTSDRLQLQLRFHPGSTRCLCLTDIRGLTVCPGIRQLRSQLAATAFLDMAGPLSMPTGQQSVLR